MTKDIVSKLQSSISRKSLSDIVKDRQSQSAHMRQAKDSFLLLDCSGSMAEYVEPGRAKIDALRDIVGALRTRIGFAEVCFPSSSRKESIAGDIPDPEGSTPLHEALLTARMRHAKHVVLISDGMPDDTRAALAEARQLKDRGVKIDVFYVGPRPHPGEEFLKLLAIETGGQFEATSLSYREQRAIESKIALLLEHKP